MKDSKDHINQTFRFVRNYQELLMSINLLNILFECVDFCFYNWFFIFSENLLVPTASWLPYLTFGFVGPSFMLFLLCLVCFWRVFKRYVLAFQVKFIGPMSKIYGLHVFLLLFLVICNWHGSNWKQYFADSISWRHKYVSLNFIHLFTKCIISTAQSIK